MHPSRLTDHARWFTYYAGEGAFGEQYTELAKFEVIPGYDPPLVKVKYAHVRRDEAAELIGSDLGTWQRSDYTVAKLRRRGVRVMKVHPAT